MKISVSPHKNMTFKGICPEYVKQNGFRVVPIAINPSQKDINKAMTIVQENNSSLDGRNGKAYMWGEDLVVKKYMSKNEAINYNPRREIDILDSMYEKNIQDANIQRGLYAFETPQGEYFLVSSQIHGVHPHRNQNCFNKENLEELVLTIQKLDEGIISTSLLGTTQTAKLLRIMHNDLSMANIKVTEDGAGILDFEYMDYRDVTDVTLAEKEKRLNGSVIMNLSEITMQPANLKDFEYRTLAQYLKKTEHPKEIFKYYLNAKSQYLEKMAQYYKKCSKNPIFTEIASNLDEISTKMKNYALLLRNAVNTNDKNILKAEAIKIQIADFLYLMTPYSNTRKFNPTQLKSYIDFAKDFFTSEYKKAVEEKDKLKIQYYLDCFDLIKNWEKTKDKIDKKSQEPKEEDFTPEQIKKGDFSYAIKVHKKFLAKTTKEYEKTLDEIIK